MSIRYKSVQHPLLFLLLWIVLISACEPCAECGKPLLFDPNIKLKFINQDSLNSLNEDLAIVTDRIDSIKSTKDSLNQKVKEWDKLLDALRDSIEGGKTEYVSDTVLIDDSIKTASGQISLLDIKLEQDSETEIIISEIISLILSGKVKLEKAVILENGNLVMYTDSMNLYVLPLLMQENLTTYAITLGEKTDTISFIYTTDLYVGPERKVEMRAFNIDTLSYTYDSLLIECKTPECRSNEVQVTIYF